MKGMFRFNYITRILFSIILFLAANARALTALSGSSGWLIPSFVLAVAINVMPSLVNWRLKSKSLREMANGCELLEIFLISTALSVVFNVAGWTGLLSVGSLKEDWRLWLTAALLCILVEAVTFWNGIIRIYILSAQLGIKWRLVGAFCGMIPLVHLIVLRMLIRRVRAEIQVENDKILLNESRCEQKICHTKYPILLVHGVFFRDFTHFNYWGRIPKELEKNGAIIYYGNHASAASVADSARELDVRIRNIVEESGCGKVNIIAHSKGGLDCRYALAQLGTLPYVASLTTMNTPHKGCEFADYLLEKIPEKQKKLVADAYNAALKKIGDDNPDFIAAVSDLTHSRCEEMSSSLYSGEDIFCQSFGSKLNKYSGGRFPLNLSYHLVKYFDGDNDGLVGQDSFQWGENYQYITTKGTRGISHGDMIDLNRENFDGFDVREFYVQLVSDLKEQGL